MDLKRGPKNQLRISVSSEASRSLRPKANFRCGSEEDLVVGNKDTTTVQASHTVAEDVQDLYGYEA